MIQTRINDSRSLGSWYIKGTEESLPRVDSSVPLMHNDPSDLGSLNLIWIIPKEHTPKISWIPQFYPWHLGYGGGYNEREGVEYIRREDSDDEFDEVRSEVQNVCLYSMLVLVLHT